MQNAKWWQTGILHSAFCSLHFKENNINYSKDDYIGKNKESIGIDSNGNLFISNGFKQEKICTEWKVNDVLGCGFALSKNLVYFTKNGKLICKIKTNCEKFFPAFQQGNYTKNDFSYSFGDKFPLLFDDVSFVKELNQF